MTAIPAKMLDAAESSGKNRQRDVLLGIAKGEPLKVIARRYGISPPREVQLKRQIAGLVVSLFGDGVLTDAGCASKWRTSLRAAVEKRALRFSRCAA